MDASCAANCQTPTPRARKLRCDETLGNVKQVTVTTSCGKWLVSVQTKQEVEQPPKRTGKTVGIDLGVNSFAVMSDGTTFISCSPLEKNLYKLAKEQRALSRKRRYRKVANIRRDYLHKTSTTVSKNHAVVCLENLKVKNMSRSAKGTLEEPGRNVRAKSGLNRAILDQGWSKFRRQLDYKLERNGGTLVVVSPYNTSRTCPGCGHVTAKNRKTQEEFACVSCGFEANADHVGAINILRAGHVRLACEVSGEVVPPAAGTR